MINRPVSYPIVSSYPSIRYDNPYLNMCQEALEECGVRFDRTSGDFLDWRWLLNNRRRVDILHLHWTQYHYVLSDRRASAVAFAKFAAKLLLARALRYRIVWTMHNLFPHERSLPPVFDYLGHMLVAQVANSVIVHCKCGQDLLARYFYRRREVFVVSLPSYCDVLSGAGSREEARADLGLQDKKQVFLFLGAIRPYKGIEDLIAAFRELSDVDRALIIAGKPANKEIEADIISQVDGDARILCDLAYVSGSRLETYLCAAAAVVLPFREILTSSSAMLALSAGRPVIAPAIGCLPELLTPECGILYDPADPDGLRKALAHCRHLDLDAMGREASHRAQQFTAERVAVGTLKAYGA